MLAIIRDKMTGWIAGLIVAALTLSFAFWGINFYLGNGAAIIVASVNDVEIERAVFQRALDDLQRQMQSVLDGPLSSEEEDYVKEQTMQKLIDSELINQFIQDSDLQISDAKIVEVIKNLDFFKNKDGFDRIKYEQGVNSLNMSPRFFEIQLRLNLLSEQLQAGFSESLFITDNERQQQLQLKSQTRDITYATVELAPFIEQSEITESEIKSFYEAHTNQYVEPEKVKIAYLELDVEKLATTIEADVDELKTYYDNNKDQYDIDERRSVSRLFIKIAVENADKTIEKASEEVRNSAKEAIELALTMVKNGMPFEQIIEKFSAEGQGALQFSEHTFIAQGVMDTEIDTFLFESDEGDVSDVIETKDSFNVVKVMEIQGGPKNNYEHVAEQVAQDYKKYQAELKFFELSDQLATLSYEHFDSLELVADIIGQNVFETDYFSREDQTLAFINSPIVDNPKVLANSFDPELIRSGQNSELIELSDLHLIVLSVVDHQPAKKKPFLDVQTEVTSDLRLQKARENIQEYIAAIVAQLKSGVALADISDKLQWTSVEKVQRDHVEINRAVLRNAFQAGRPIAGKPAIASNRLGSGDYIITLVTAVYNSQTAFDDELVQSTDVEILQEKGSSEWQNFLEDARKKADIIIYEDRI